MSLQNARRFTQQVSGDATLQKKVSAANSAADVVSVAAAAGFKFSVSDLETLATEWSESTEIGVSPEDLEEGIKKSTIRKCLTKPKTCGTPCCQIEPV